MKKLFSIITCICVVSVAVAQPGHSRRVVVHRGPVVVNRGPVVVSRPPVIYHAPVYRAPVYYPYHGISYRYSGGYYYRPYGSYWRVTFPPVGLRVSVLPFGYSSFYFGPNMYYYNEGVYYRRYNNSYEVVDPPVGATLSSLPRGAKSVSVNGEQFYELNGTYYKETTNDAGKTVYVVTGKNEVNNSVTEDNNQDQQNFTPQQGDVVDQLPDNCKTITLNGNTYYVSPDNIYYQSFQQDGATRYEVVGQPADSDGDVRKD